MMFGESKQCISGIMSGKQIRSSLVSDVLGSGDGQVPLHLSVLLVVLWVFLVNLVLERKRQENGKEFDINSIPGPRPFPLKVIGNTFQFLPPKTTIKKLLEVSREHGHLIKATGLNMDLILLNSPSAIQILLKSSDMGHLSKIPAMYNLIKDLSEGVLVSNGSLWKSRRKILLKSMTQMSLRNYVPVLNRHGNRLINLLEKLFDDKETHNINALLNVSTLSVVHEVATGLDFENMEEGMKFVNSMIIHQETLTYRMTHPWLVPDWIWQLHSMSKKRQNCIDVIDAFVLKAIQTKKMQTTKEQNKNLEESCKFRCLLDDLLEENLTDVDLLGELKIFMLAGNETTSHSLHYFCYLMALNPEEQKKCQEEIDKAFDSSLNNLDFDQVSSLKYLEWCLLETLRMYSPVLAYGRRLNSPLDFGDSIILPTGTNVIISPLVIHRNPKYFPNPDTFQPSRFSPEESVNRHPYAFVPFSHGSRNCLGYKFALLEMKALAAKILRNFFITTTTKIENVILMPNSIVSPEHDFDFRFDKRQMC